MPEKDHLLHRSHEIQETPSSASRWLNKLLVVSFIIASVPKPGALTELSIINFAHSELFFYLMLPQKIFKTSSLEYQWEFLEKDMTYAL